MRIIIYLGVIILMMGCKKYPNLEGKWKVVDPFFSATYKINQSTNGYSAQLLTLNDGTTHYKYQNEENKLWEFLDTELLESKKLDAISGATKTQTSTHNIEIISTDSIKVVTTEFNKTKSYLWIKINTNLSHEH